MLPRGRPIYRANNRAFVRGLGPAAWYQYGTGITSATALVSQWDDQSGNARHLVQSTDTNKPTLDTDNSLLFDGTDNYMQVAFTLNQPNTRYILVKQVSWTNNEPIVGGFTNASNIRQSGVSPALQVNSASSGPSTSDAAVGSFAAVAAVFNGASSTIQANNGAVTTADSGANVAGGITLGANHTATTFGHAAFKEVAVFAAAHGAATRDRVIRYFMQVGGI